MIFDVSLRLEFRSFDCMRHSYTFNPNNIRLIKDSSTIQVCIPTAETTKYDSNKSKISPQSPTC